MRKPLFTAALAMLAASAAHAQKLPAAQVPPAATVTFQKAFPAVKTVQWEKEGADYEAGFTMGKAGMSAVISANGMLKETETEIAVAQLPMPVQKALANKYKTYKIIEAAKIVKAATGTIIYEAEVTQVGKHHDVLFKADGTEVNK